MTTAVPSVWRYCSAGFRLSSAAKYAVYALLGCATVVCQPLTTKAATAVPDFSKETNPVCDIWPSQALDFYDQSDFSSAEDAFQTAIMCYETFGDRAGEAETHGNLGMLYHYQGRNTDALEQFETALAILEEVGDSAGAAIILSSIGQVYYIQGQYAKALDYFQTALATARQVGDRKSEAKALADIGAVYFGQGRYHEARLHLESALSIAREIGDPTNTGIVLHNIGEIYAEQGRYTEALQYMDEALAKAREAGDDRGEGEILDSIGGIYSSQKRYTEALVKLDAALAIARKVGDRAGESSALTKIGVVYEAQERYSEALEQLESALKIARELEDRVTEAADLQNIGAVHYSQGRFADALKQYKAALEILRDVGFRAGEGTILENIAVTYESQTKYAEAVKYYIQSIDLFDDLRAVAGSEAARSGLISLHSNPYGSAVNLYLKLNQGADAFELSERGRARAFLDSLTTGQVELSDSAASELLAAEQQAYAVRQSAQIALNHAEASGPQDQQFLANLKRQLADAQATYSTTLAAIQAQGDQLNLLVPVRRNNVLSLKQVQALLDPQTTLISYWLLGDKTAAFVITASDFTIVELPDAKLDDIRMAVRSLYNWANKDNPYPRPLRNLYRWLIQPLADHLNTPHVAIVPHQELHSVPFSALGDGSSYFGDQHTITILPSASSLKYLYDNARKAATTATNNAKPIAVVYGNPATNMSDLQRLPLAESEATAVAELLDTQVYTGPAASELRLRAIMGGTEILHLAAHGLYDPTEPLDSFIALAPGGDQDGRLEAREVFGLPLAGTRLVVLSACETSRGQLSRGDEVVGLTRAFFFAGASAVLSSLWNVDDAATEHLMTSFYRYWLGDGMSQTEALQAAQASVRSNPKWVSPFYWAAFNLNGVPDQAELAAPH